MYKISKFFLLIFVIITTNAISKEDFFNKAKSLFENGKLEESKFLFQRNIVFNPKDSRSYLYLAKIYETEENEREKETWKVKMNNATLWCVCVKSRRCSRRGAGGKLRLKLYLVKLFSPLLLGLLHSVGSWKVV